MTSDSVAKTMLLHPEGIRAPIKMPINRGVSSTLQHFHNDINKVDTLELEFDCVLSYKSSFFSAEYIFFMKLITALQIFTLYLF